MAQGLITLLSLCVVMAAASFLAGILPLALNLSSKRLRLVSNIGMGVLVGTSLIVIIPEGVDTLYGSTSEHAHARRDLLTRHPKVQTTQENTLDLLAPFDRRYEPTLEDLASPGPVIPDSNALPPPKTPTDPGTISILEESPDQSHKAADDNHEEAHHAWIGIALVSGFILMFLIDKLPQYTPTTKSPTHTRHISLTNLGRRFNLTTLDRPDEESDNFLESSSPSSTPSDTSRSFATTTGLVIHAAADGIALGASSSTSNTSLSFVIFFAIMVHKAPAAFGLTSVLLKQGLSKRMARAHLVIFSLAAPAGAFFTFMAVNLLGGGGGAARSPESSQWWTGVLLLFSAGTFLYVAMHSMQEITGQHGHKHGESHVNGTANGSIHEGREGPAPEEKPSIADLGAAVFGMILPLFLQVGHAH